uniref:Aminopeptidase n=1 Tax=Ascaris lumbricoides TaxID=6252 RepID=A0A9J2P9I1_ASCLU
MAIQEDVTKIRSRMPTPTTVKLLLDESHRDGEEDIALIGGNWIVSAVREPSTSHRNSTHWSRFCAFLASSLIVMIIGMLIGVFILPQLIASNECQLESTSLEQTPCYEMPSNSNRCPPDEISATEELYPAQTARNIEETSLPLMPFCRENLLEFMTNSRKERKTLQKAQSEQRSLEEHVIDECGQFYPWRNIRLPYNIIPLTYKLRLQPNLSTSTISGSVQIELKIAKPTKNIVLHALELNLTSFEIRLAGVPVSAHHSKCERLSQWAFELEHELNERDNVSLVIDYDGHIHNDLSALYTNVHIAEDNKKILSAVTQFEPTHARKMLPCFDEPIYKATFEVAVIRQSIHIVRANMHLIRTEPYANGFELFSHFRVLAMEFFESYFALPYPLQKLDMIALDDFAEGAMENWGMTTFRDAMLLHSSTGSTTKSKETVALVICHEYAHQMDDFNIENFVTSMLLDGFDNSHAVSTNVDDPAQIGSIFDAISYQKGASIIGMIMGLVGKENFKKSLREYLKIYAYSNADGEDLWTVIEKHSSLTVANISIAEIAEAWTTRVGYPFITASIDTNQTSIVIHNQTRFMFLEASRKENHSTEWPIPIHYRTNFSDMLSISWMKPGDRNVRITLEKPAKWVIVNAHSLGYLRVLYEHNIYKEFVKQLREDHQAISAVDRASIINDAFSFAKAGLLPIETAMNLVQYVEKVDEMERIPWNVIIGHLKSIENCIFESEHIDLFQEFMRSLLMRAYQRLGWSHKEEHVERLLQTEILALACKLQVGDCSRHATQRFHQWTHDKTSVPIDLQPLVIEEGIRRGTPIDWERVYQEYLITRNPSQKFMLLAALSSTRDIRLIYRFLNMCLKPSIVRQNLVPKALALLIQNPAAQLHAWRFFRIHFEHFDHTIGSTTTMLGMTIKSLIESFNTQFDIDETLQFFKGRNLGASQSKVDQALDSIRVNIQWRRLNEKALGKWLRQWNKDRSLQ